MEFAGKSIGHARKSMGLPRGVLEFPGISDEPDAPDANDILQGIGVDGLAPGASSTSGSGVVSGEGVSGYEQSGRCS